VDRQERRGATPQIRRKRLQDRLQQNYQRGLSLALTDPLTSLYVRRYGEAHLDGLMSGQPDAKARLFCCSTSTISSRSTTPRHDAGDDVRGSLLHGRSRVFAALISRCDGAEKNFSW
jgi:hypothetical protein